MRVLALIHASHARSGHFGVVVEELGHELIEWDIAREPKPEPLAYDALITFGGAMHADQESVHPWLHTERELLAEALAQRTPVFAICLGAQLLAQVAGAQVRQMPVPEVGWCEVELTTEAARDPLFAGLEPLLTAFEWHHYQFAVPPAATLLAANPVGPQAYRLGSAWGVQFHPEVTAAILSDWFAFERRHDTARRAGFDPAHLVEHTEEHLKAWQTVGEHLLVRFLAQAEPRAPGWRAFASRLRGRLRRRR